MTTKPQWRTLTIRINPTTRKNVAMQARFPLTPEEWGRLLEQLEKLRPELVAES